ncbi:hypothetical protein GCM10022251_32360 [Phytohabitans flavus]|uniref:SMP-30/Gluconolactonase/LRE-like region domain-containing protein n=1 Tax=Phytohabitans flavus TaxID=1076124 RepID=A0A6F8XWG6_9ACTN|nr:SMP-30/gluconolactonase/LRE family protein [Phytohabitans flavus]BCB78153.1 hypothetical protein Pflav_045630 [Phytohabitans flavus]
MSADLVSAGLLAAGATVERLATGFMFTEGPVWHAPSATLLFSDMPGDVRRRWSAASGVEEVRRPANKCNGMAYDAAGNLLVCEHATSRLVRERPDGGVDVLASHHDGAELQSPNDVVVRSDGSVYFSDPWYGRVEGFGVPREKSLPFQGVYRIAPNGTQSLAAAKDEFDLPNGLCFAPGERILYVNDTGRCHIKAFDVAPDGSLAGGRLFAEGIGSAESTTGVPDGMKTDERGNVWVTGPGGIWVYAPDGARLGVLAVPEVVGNLTWGGPDRRDLYICASTSLYRVPTLVAGNPVPGPVGEEASMPSPG